MKSISNCLNITVSVLMMGDDMLCDRGHEEYNWQHAPSTATRWGRLIPSGLDSHSDMLYMLRRRVAYDGIRQMCSFLSSSALSSGITPHAVHELPGSWTG